MASLGFPVGADSKESACEAGGWGSILGEEEPLEKGMAIHSSILGASLVAQTLKIASRLKKLNGNQDCS